MLRARLNSAPQSYASRALALRGEDMQRRISVVLPRELKLPADWLQALAEQVPVYREQSAREAAAYAEQLGDSREGARIMDSKIDAASWRKLVEQADSAAVTFARREHELAWVQRVLKYGDIS